MRGVKTCERLRGEDREKKREERERREEERSEVCEVL